MARTATFATAVWDDNSDPSNPGWVVKIRYQDEGHGEREEVFAPHPQYYHLPRSASRAEKIQMIKATLSWERFQLGHGGISV